MASSGRAAEVGLEAEQAAGAGRDPGAALRRHRGKRVCRSRPAQQFRPALHREVHELGVHGIAAEAEGRLGETPALLPLPDVQRHARGCARERALERSSQAPRRASAAATPGERNSPQTLWRGSGDFSNSRTAAPSPSAASAAAEPAGPAPTICTARIPRSFWHDGIQPDTTPAAIMCPGSRFRQSWTTSRRR